jgi:hypothetical protein
MGRKAEIRRPKAEIRKKAEGRSPKTEAAKLIEKVSERST